MTFLVGILFVAAGVGLIALGKAHRDGTPKAFIRGSSVLEAFYPVLCLALLMTGLVLLLMGEPQGNYGGDST